MNPALKARLDARQAERDQKKQAAQNAKKQSNEVVERFQTQFNNLNKGFRLEQFASASICHPVSP
jgi:hypothetical protein